QIDAERPPVRQGLHRIEVGDLATADDEAAAARRDFLGPAAVVGVDLEERRQGLDILDIGNRYGDEQLLLQRHPQQRPTDATETMNGDPGHDMPLSWCVRYSTGHGSTCQMSLAYSAMVRSLEKVLDAAMLRTALRDHCS